MEAEAVRQALDLGANGTHGLFEHPDAASVSVRSRGDHHVGWVLLHRRRQQRQVLRNRYRLTAALSLKWRRTRSAAPQAAAALGGDVGWSHGMQQPRRLRQQPAPVIGTR